VAIFSGSQTVLIPFIFSNISTFNYFQAAFEDLDNDGDKDGVFTNMAFNHSQVLFNDGKGNFVDSGQKLTQCGHGVGVGDFDNDGDLDLFISCAGWNEGGKKYDYPSKIYFNDGKGIFKDSGQDLGDLKLSGNGIKIFDLEGDGDLDAHIHY